MAGTFVTSASLRNIFWEIDGVGLIVATALLAVKYGKRGCDFIAAGFLVFSIGESVMLAGTPGSLEGMVPSFGAGTALWASALAMVSIPREFPLFSRVSGVIACVLFSLTSVRVFLGDVVVAVAKLLPALSDPLL